MSPVVITLLNVDLQFGRASKSRPSSQLSMDCEGSRLQNVRDTGEKEKKQAGEE